MRRALERRSDWRALQAVRTLTTARAAHAAARLQQAAALHEQADSAMAQATDQALAIEAARRELSAEGQALRLGTLGMLSRQAVAAADLLAVRQRAEAEADAVLDEEQQAVQRCRSELRTLDDALKAVRKRAELEHERKAAVELDAAWLMRRAHLEDEA
ncbi:MAG: hypothetical protein EPO01_09105 [Aquabacterium sp.]|nr:MAG: hypothetical protein EPO12_04530 [Aquabacterium sp.]TAL22406.1 MAG: hypothetical protein EPO01_09105 [Aquabacterium sp.]